METQNTVKIVETFTVTIEGRILEFTKYDDGTEIVVEIEQSQPQQNS